MTADSIIFEAYRDIGGLRPGQTMSQDSKNECFTALNELLDSLTLERMPVLQSTGTVLSSFADLTTSYTLAPGWAQYLRKEMGVKMAPMMKIYFKIPDPLLKEVATEAAMMKQMLRGVGV